MNPPAAHLYPAAPLAAALGLSKRAVSARLDADAAGVGMVRGQQADAWPISALPESWRAKGEEAARAGGYRNFEAMLTAPPAPPWQPTIRRDGREEPVTLAEMHPDCLAAAVKLQKAFAPSLARNDALSLSEAEFEDRGVDDYARIFGHRITRRYFREIYRRTLARAGGAEDFGRVEIYLPNQLKRKSDALPAFSAALGEEFRELHDVMATFTNPAGPTSAEESLLWLRAFELLESLIGGGKAEKKLRGRLLKFLWKHAPWLAASPNALRVAAERKLRRWREQDHAAAALVDKREAKRGKAKVPAYDPEQVGLVKLYAAEITGGRVSQAARELNERGLITDPRLKRALDTATSKSYLPQSFRDETKDVGAWHIHAIGERAGKKMVPSQTLTYDGIYSMTCLTGDDLTPPVRFWIPDPETGWARMIRGQFIATCDFRSLFIPSFALVPAEGYTALTVYGAFRTAFEEYGLPKFILREGGLWRKAKLVNSIRQIGSGRSPSEVEMGLRQKSVQFCAGGEEFLAKFGDAGIQFREAYVARAKPIEGVFRMLQYKMGGEPGWCGLNERSERPEKLDRDLYLIEKRQPHPSELGYYSFAQWTDRLAEIVARYHAERQEGRRLANPETGAAMSPEEAFEYFQNREDPPVHIDDECRVLLSAIREEIEVKRPDIRRRQFPCGYVKLRGHTYCNEETGRRIGQKLIAHFDPLMPEICTFTDLNMRHPFSVPRLEPVNALTITAQTGASIAQARSAIIPVRTAFMAMKAKFEPILRRNIVSRKTRELSAHVKEASQANQQREQATQRRAASIRRKGSALNIPAPLLADDEQTRAALELMADAQREHQAAGQRRETSPAETDLP